MTKEITKAYIIQQMQDKFKLRELEPEIFRFSEMVVPTYDIGQHVKYPIIERAEVPITGAAAFVFFTVPENEKWYLNRYNVIFMGAGAIKVTGVYIRRANNPYAMYLDMVLNQAVSYTNDLPKPVEMVSGDALYVLVDDYISTQSLRLYIDYTKEDVR